MSDHHDFIEYFCGYKYVLAGVHVSKTRIKPRRDILSHMITLGADGTLTLAAGFAWDGPSGPTIDSSSGMRAAAKHDAFYRLIRRGLLSPAYKHEIDDEFYDDLITDGMNPLRAKVWYLGVHHFGASSIDPSNVKVIKKAPYVN